MTYNNGVVNTYADGVVVDTYNGSGTIIDVYPAFNELQIGGRENATDQRFAGEIDEVRVWNTERTLLNIQTNMNAQLVGNETGLLGNWRFDEGSGTTITDQSLNGHHGTLADGVTVAEMPAWEGYVVAEDGTLNVSAANGVLANDFDIDGDPLTTVLDSGPSNAATFTLNPDGSFTYTPTADFNGIDSFTYHANDGSTDSNTVTVTIRVDPLNDAPVVNATASDTGTEDTDVVYTHAQLLTLIGATDVDDVDTDLSISITNVANGTLVMSGGTGGAGTTFTFTPTANFAGNLSFDYQVSDDASPTPASSAVGTATVAIAAVNDVPVASANTVSITEDNAYSFGVGDFTYSDVEGDSLVSVMITNLNLAGGTLEHSGGTPVTNGMTLTAAQIATLVYTPAGNASGAPLATFDFSVNDAGPGVSTAQLDIDVTPVNDAPTAIGLSNSSIDENTETSGGYSVGILTSTDPDTGDSHGYTVVGGADMGFFSIGGAGSDELILTDGALDFESRSSYEVIVRSTDNGSPNLFHDETLTITVNNETGNISGTIYTDEGVASIGAGANISMVVNGVLTETVTTDGAGSYSFTKEAVAGDAVAIFIDNDPAYQGITVTVSDGTDLANVQVYANHIVVRNDSGSAISIADMDNALGAYADPDIHYAVIGGNLVANAVGSELLVPAGHTFTPGGDVNATSIKVMGTVNGGNNTFNIAENWDSAAGSWFANTSTVNLIGTGTLNSAGDSFYNLTAGAASQTTTLTSDLQVGNVLTIADSTGTLTDNGSGYDITVTGAGTPFVNNGAAVTAKNFIYRYPTDATITAAGGTYNVAENLWIAGSGTGSGTTYQLNGNLLVSGGLHVYATSFGVSILDTMGHSITADSLQVSDSAFQVGFLYANDSIIDINGDVNFVNSVTTVVDLGDSDWSVYGDWTNYSNTFVAGSSTVTLDGVNQRISGSTSFYNLSKVETINDGIDSILIFDNAATQTINGTLTLTGLDADDRALAWFRMRRAISGGLT